MDQEEIEQRLMIIRDFIGVFNATERENQEQLDQLWADKIADEDRLDYAQINWDGDEAAYLFQMIDVIEARMRFTKERIFTTSEFGQTASGNNNFSDDIQGHWQLMQTLMAQVHEAKVRLERSHAFYVDPSETDYLNDIFLETKDFLANKAAEKNLQPLKSGVVVAVNFGPKEDKRSDADRQAHQARVLASNAERHATIIRAFAEERALRGLGLLEHVYILKSAELAGDRPKSDAWDNYIDRAMEYCRQTIALIAKMPDIEAKKYELIAVNADQGELYGITPIHDFDFLGPLVADFSAPPPSKEKTAEMLGDQNPITELQKELTDKGYIDTSDRSVSQSDMVDHVNEQKKIIQGLLNIVAYTYERININSAIAELTVGENQEQARLEMVRDFNKTSRLLRALGEYHTDVLAATFGTDDFRESSDTIQMLSTLEIGFKGVVRDAEKGKAAAFRHIGKIQDESDVVKTTPSLLDKLYSDRADTILKINAGYKQINNALNAADKSVSGAFTARANRAIHSIGEDDTGALEDELEFLEQSYRDEVEIMRERIRPLIPRPTLKPIAA